MTIKMIEVDTVEHVIFFNRDCGTGLRCSLDFPIDEGKEYNYAILNEMTSDRYYFVEGLEIIEKASNYYITITGKNMSRFNQIPSKDEVMQELI